MALSITALSQAGITVFVDPQGNDSWDGTASTHTSSSTGPVASLTRARDVLRAYRLRGDTSPSIIQLSSGTYYVGSTVTLGSQDSNLTIQAAGNGIVRLTGALPITGWQYAGLGSRTGSRGSDGLSRVLKASLPANGITDYGVLTSRSFFNGMTVPSALELICNDSPMTLAQWPNTGYVHIQSVNGTNLTLDTPIRTYAAAPSTGMVAGYFCADWADFSEPITGINTASNVVQTITPAQFGISAGGRVKIVNFLEDVDSPGEYFIDRGNGTIYFYPPTPTTAPVTSGTILRTCFISATGASSLTLRGLTIENGRGNGVEIDAGKNNLIDSCTIRNVGDTGVVFNVSTASGMQNSIVANTGDIGVYLYGGNRATLTSCGMFVKNCRITGFGRIERCSRPAVAMNGDGETVQNCTISNGPHAGITFNGNDHLIKDNVIDSVCTETGDAGAVYTGRDVTALGNIVSGNLFMNLQPRVVRPGAVETVAGIYLDDNATGTTTIGNAFYNVQVGVLIGGGACNSVQNSMFVMTTIPVYIDARSAVNPAGFSANGAYTAQINGLGSSLSLYRSRYPQWAQWLDGNRTLPRFTTVSRCIFPTTTSIDYADSQYTMANTTVTQIAVSLNPAINPPAQDFGLIDPSLGASINFNPIGYGKGAVGTVGAGAADGTGSGA